MRIFVVICLLSFSYSCRTVNDRSEISGEDDQLEVKNFIANNQDWKSFSKSVSALDVDLIVKSKIVNVSGLQQCMAALSSPEGKNANELFYLPRTLAKISKKSKISNADAKPKIILGAFESVYAVGVKVEVGIDCYQESDVSETDVPLFSRVNRSINLIEAASVESSDSFYLSYYDYRMADRNEKNLFSSDEFYSVLLPGIPKLEKHLSELNKDSDIKVVVQIESESKAGEIQRQIYNSRTSYKIYLSIQPTEKLQNVIDAILGLKKENLRNIIDSRTFLGQSLNQR